MSCQKSSENRPEIVQKCNGPENAKKISSNVTFITQKVYENVSETVTK